MRKIPGNLPSWWAVAMQLEKEGLLCKDDGHKVVIPTGKYGYIGIEDVVYTVGEIKSKAFSEVKRMVPPEHKVRRMIAYLNYLEIGEGAGEDEKLHKFLETILEVFYSQ